MKKPELHHEALDHELALLQAEQKIGKETGFIRRRPRKIEPLQLLKAFFILLPDSCPSLRSLAVTLSALRSQSISKQAIARRIGKPWVEFLKQILSLLLCKHIRSGTTTAFNAFNRVLLHDSSVLPLPGKMARYYKGSSNWHGRYSQAKVQAILDIKSRSYIKFDVTSFARNDQSAASDVLSIIRAGDIIIRDLGYFVIDILRRIHKARAFFVSRYHHRCSIFDHNCNPLDILALLEKDTMLDRWVRIGSVEKMPVRMIALPLAPHVASERRRLARQCGDGRFQPGKKYLQLLGWSIFITNVTEDIWDAQKISDIYKLRWRIEIVFKAWKSHFGITSYSHTSSRYQIESIIYTRLIYVLLFQISIYNPLMRHVESRYKQKVSFLKLASLFTRYHWLILFHAPNNDFFIEILAYFCSYDKRRRLNYEDVLETFAEKEETLS